MPRRRLDALLVERGLVESREKAKALILAGDVLVDGAVVDRPAAPVAPGTDIRLREKLPFVSRGGLKLAHALDVFQVDVASKVAVDIGASTGGFTDCLLQRGAARVYAVDVGYGQLDYRLRRDPRVVVMERVNARYLTSLSEVPEIATIDVSFISLTKILPAVRRLLAPAGQVIALIKPQFELERGLVARGGVVKDPALHARACADVMLWAIDNGYAIGGLTPSPILGAEGNREFLLLLRLKWDNT